MLLECWKWQKVHVFKSKEVTDSHWQQTCSLYWSWPSARIPSSTSRACFLVSVWELASYLHNFMFSFASQFQIAVYFHLPCWWHQWLHCAWPPEGGWARWSHCMQHSAAESSPPWSCCSHTRSWQAASRRCPHCQTLPPGAGQILPPVNYLIMLREWMINFPLTRNFPCSSHLVKNIHSGINI